MWGAIIGAVAQAIPAVIQAVKGGEQMAEAKGGLASLKRPQYYDAISRMAYGDKTMPGEVNMLDRNDLIAQNAYIKASESGNPLALIPTIQATNQKGAIDIGIASAQNREQDMLRLKSALDAEYQMNKFAPYAEKAQEYRAMMGAGEKNQFSGISNMSGIASSIFSNMDTNGNDTGNYNDSAAMSAGDTYKENWGMSDTYGMSGEDSSLSDYEQFLKAKKSGFGKFGMYKY